jgi:uncharacterized membrane protein
MRRRMEGKKFFKSNIIVCRDIKIVLVYYFLFLSFASLLLTTPILRYHKNREVFEVKKREWNITQLKFCVVLGGR